MKIASFRDANRSSWGVVLGDVVFDAGAGTGAPDLKSWLASGGTWAELERAAAGGTATVRLADVDLLPPIPNPDRILCVGVNYEEHRKETGRAPSAHPTIFTRFASTLAAHGEALLLPRVSSQLDFEGELAVVVGAPGRYLDEATALACVAGYSCFDDGSVRDFQTHASQFTPGKNFPRTGGFGPWLVTPDEVGDVRDLSLVTRVSGVEMQRARVGDMTFGIARLLAYVSSFTPLSPGDVIATGTPSGVGWKRSPPRWLVDGDLVEVTIDRVGTLANVVRAE